MNVYTCQETEQKFKLCSSENHFSGNIFVTFVLFECQHTAEGRAEGHSHFLVSFDKGREVIVVATLSDCS